MSTRRRMLTSVVAGAALAGGGVFVAAQATTPTGPAGVSASTVAADAGLTATLRFAREEERMARDLYAALADRYDGAMPFAMITRSEQQHFDAVGALLGRYDVADPADGRKAGSYADPTIQKLYDGWLADGKASLDAAYDVGVALEKRDIADLKGSLASVDQADARRVLTALLAGSQHHLAAFHAAADGRAWSGSDGRGYGMGPGMMQGTGTGMGMGGGYGMGRGQGRNGLGDCPMLDTVSD